MIFYNADLYGKYIFLKKVLDKTDITVYTVYIQMKGDA